MADYKKYKVGITVKEPWADNISYEQLDMALFAVENGGDGCAYVALKPNIGVRPNQDPTTWIKATQRGQSIYDYCIEYGLFVGTEEEFAQDYADAVQAAKDAAASATQVEEEVSAAEQGRVSAENARVSAESQRASAEESRVSYEAQRSVNETGRVNAEDSRVAAENARVVAESQRASAESTRATNEENRRAEFGGMMRDAETAIGLVDAAMTEAENVDATVDGMIVTITDRHGVSKSVNIGFDIYRTYGSVAAMNADAANVEDGKFVMIATLDPTSTENAQLWVRNSNAATSQNPFTFLSDLDQASSAAWADWMENQKPIIEADHTTAVADHTQAVSDHMNATNDHAVAGQDHTTAGTDHTQAVSDSTRAGQDHSVAEQDHTRAEGDHSTASTDHSTAQSDHTTAETDHTTASSDHTIASGDHTTALSDHGIASTDHTTAQGDHTQAADDHSIASTDHANATSDHTLAGNDHTRAESDHSTAAEDHTNAAADHTQAGEDHAQYLLDHDSIASKANVAPNPTEGNVAALDSGGNPIDSGIPSEKVAKTDGFYEGMGVGVAKRLDGNTDVAGSFLERPTGGDAELANGLAQLNEVQGGSVKFNQLISNDSLFPSGGTLTKNNNVITFVGTAGVEQKYVKANIIYKFVHIYLTSFLYKSDKQFYLQSTKSITYTANASTEWKKVSVLGSRTDSAHNSAYLYNYTTLDSAWNLEIKDFMAFDLTAIFGAGNEPTTVEEFEAWLAENVGLKEYYDYTDGEVVNNNMTGIESNGFNLFNPTTGKARIIGAYSEVYGNYYGITGTHGTLTFEDDLGNVSTVTPDSDGKFELDVSGYLSVANAGSDVAVFLWWDGNKTEYEDYDVEIAHLDVRHIYGKKNGTGDLVQVWPTGMPRINDVVDKLCIENGAVVAKRPIQEVDLGTQTWSKVTETRFSTIVEGMRNVSNVALGTGLLCAKYESTSATGWDSLQDKQIGSSSSGNLNIKDGTYSDSDAATFKTAMNGVILYYKLATPETYTDLVYMGSEYFADGTPVALPVNYKVDNWGVETILPKNTGTILTAKPTIKVRYAIDAVEQLDTHEAFIEAMPENYVKRSTLAQGMGNSTVNAMSQDAITKLLNELYQSLGVAEGYIRVAGSSSPALSFKHYENSEFGQKSAYSLFFPCLVGTPLTGEGTEGKILYTLKKLGARVATSEDTGFTEGQAVWEDLDGTLHAIDGSEGDVMICNIEPYYRIIGKHTIEGTEYDVFLMSSKPFTWHGITAEEVGKFGWAPDYCVSHTDSDSVQRMHSVYNPSWNGSYQAPDSCVGKFVYGIDAETGDITETYDATATLLGGAGGLHSTDISLPNGEQYAMNNNTDTTKTVPWMNATAAGAENLMALIISEGGTFDAHNATLMGSGFCGNDGATTEADWVENASGAKNGMRLKDKNDVWKYYSIAGNVKTILAKDSNFYAGQMINTYRNPWHIMEAHRAVCYAVQNGVQELEWFVFEGNKYKYRSITGFRSPAQGEMTCVVFKLMATKAASNVVDPTDTTTSIEGNRIEFLVSTALLHGMTTQVSPSWLTSGLIFTEDENQGYKAYMERDQSKLIKSVAGDKLTSESWDFETAYKHVGTFTNGEGYRKNYSNAALMLPDTNANKSGAGLHTYVGAYNWFTGSAAPTGKKSVRGFRRGNIVVNPSLSPLTMYARSAPSSSFTSCAFGTCVQIVD